MATVAPHDDARELPIAAWPTQKDAAAMLGIAESTLMRHPEADFVRQGRKEKRYRPLTLLALAEQYRRVPTSQVAGSLMTYAETHAPEAVGAVEAEIDAFYAARPQGGSIHPEAVLTILRRTLPPSVLRRVERVLAEEGVR